MIQKGMMKPFKKRLGAYLLLLGIVLLLDFDKVMVYIHQYPMIYAGLIIVAGYFLFISGRQL